VRFLVAITASCIFRYSLLLDAKYLAQF